MTSMNSLIPVQLNVGSLDAYISSVNRLPMLSASEEIRLAREFRDHENLEIWIASRRPNSRRQYWPYESCETL
jgi:DNA-directed RNA polymerase sigma subunit (sigma70/sigma32)